jgi:predicted DNA-binding transcriptional regulator YafY
MIPTDKSAEKFERQMNLLAALSDTVQGIRAVDVQQRVPGYNSDHDSFRRTFERDKKDLLSLGVPIEVVAGATADLTAYRVDKSKYELPDPGLESDELAALHLALETVTVGSSPGDMARAMWRLGGVVDASSRDSVGIPVGELTEIPSDSSLVPLFRAVTERRVVSFTYESSTGISHRSVEPWHLDFKRGRWNLTAFDLERGEQRNFRLDRVRSDVQLDEPGSHSHPIPSTPSEPADPWEFGDNEPVLMTVRFDSEVSDFARQSLSSCAVSEQASGELTFQVPVANWPAFRSFVLSFLDHAEILEPPEARASMIEWLEIISGDNRG